MLALPVKVDWYNRHMARNVREFFHHTIRDILSRSLNPPGLPHPPLSVGLWCYNGGMKRTALRRKSPKKRTIRKTKPKGYRPPEWFNNITPGGHGSTIAQKRLWRVVSEFVRQRDHERYGGRCVSCAAVLSHWRDGHAGHYLPFSICHSWYKFDTENIHLQCAGCNMALYRSGAHIGHAMGEELKRRYGADILARIPANNERFRGQKMELWEIVATAERLLKDIRHLPRPEPF